MKRIGILGGGGWGTALAVVLAPRFHRVDLWVRRPELEEEIRRLGLNPTYLPGIAIPPNVHVTSQLERAVSEADVMLGVVPSHVVRPVFQQLRPFLRPGIPVVSAAKGLEARTLLRMSEVMQQVLGAGNPVVAFSGPSFAPEVAAGRPTALVAASRDGEAAREIQAAFSGPTLRIYASDDPAGVELGGALKNVIAIGAGMCDGLGLGHNALAALITRGLAESTRLAVAFGGRRDTLSGLAGLGDLVLTCTGHLSRNRQVGRKLAAGMGLRNILDSTPMVAEGVKTTGVVVEAAARLGVEMPITQEVHAVLNKGRTPAEAIKRLMTRSLRDESEAQ